MNLLFSCIGKRGYMAEYFRPHLRPGEKIIGTSNTPWTPGFSACDLGLLMPPIISDEYIPAVLEACRTHEIGGLLSFFDPDVVALSANHDALAAAGVMAVVPSQAAAHCALDKWLTFHALRDAGLLVPETVISLEAAREKLAVGDFRFPLVVKPRHGFGSANVFVAKDNAQMEAFFGYAPDMLVQQFAEGEAYNVDALADLGGRMLNVVVWRKYQSRLGETEQAVTVEDSEITALGLRLAGAMGCQGPMDVDFIRGPDGDIWILEVNLRFGGGYPVSHLAGADFPEAIVRLLRGDQVEPHIGRYERGVCLLKGVSVMGGKTDAFLARLRNSGPN
jgi:carbamoyl-phosphate synthase large subunit